MIIQSESIKEIATALCNFQKEVCPVKKDGKNPFFKSKYATLSAILKEIKKPMADNGLSIAQFPIGEHSMVTMLMHTSGEFLQTSYTMTPVKQDPQSEGSRITYQRRYALGAVLGLDIDEDDDANSVSNVSKQNDSKPASNKPVVNNSIADGASEPQKKAIYAISKAKNIDHKEFIKNTFGKDSSTELTKKEASAVIDWLNSSPVVVEQEEWEQ